MTRFHFKHHIHPHHDDWVTLGVVALVLAVLILIALGTLYLPYSQLPISDPFKLTPMPMNPW